jgi:hypothetical protein
MQTLETGIYGAKVQSWSDSKPRAVLARLMEANPSASRDAIAALFWEEVREDFDCLKAITLEYWLPNNYLQLTKPRPKQSSGSRSFAQAQASVKSAIKKKVETGIKIALLQMEMPNGKKLSNCTGRECAQLSTKVGSWLERVAAKLKPSEIVGDKLSESDLRRLY